MPSQVNFIISGEVRLLVESLEDDSLITINKLSEASLIGWVGLLRGEACETIQASTEVETIGINSETFVRLILTENHFREYFAKQTNVQETWLILRKYLKQFPYQSNELDNIVRNACAKAETKENLENYSLDHDYFLSTAQCNIDLGSNLSKIHN